MDKLERRDRIRNLIKSRGKLGAFVSSWNVSRYRLAKLTDDLPDGEVFDKFVKTFSVDPGEFWDGDDLDKIRARTGNRGRPVGAKVRKTKLVEIMLSSNDDDDDYIDDLDHFF